MKKVSHQCTNVFFIIGVLLYASSLYGGYVVVPGDEAYYKVDENNVTLLFTKQNQYAAKQALALEAPLHRAYESSFGYKMDERLYVGILSDQNQVANGFVTPFPYNLQMNYIGGALKVDYFSTTSWLNTLLYHETSHNYQVNAKASEVTQAIHTVFGNGMVALEYFPVISLPNGTISSNLLEGNAVLNESWHGNGGRLYSGRHKAATLLQAKAGHINASFLYNEKTHEFPYYDRHYIVGGFFQLYLAEIYGIDRVNSFFYNNSKSWLWPFQTNKTFLMTFGVNYEEALVGFNSWLLKKGEGLVEVKGDVIARSKRFASLNNNCDKIFFLISDAQRAPELVRLFKADKYVEKERESFFYNKVFNLKDTYYTQGSGYSDVSHRYIGLFDAEGRLKKESASQVIQGYLKGGIPVYFNVASSFDQPQLYVGDSWYAQVNSSVYIDAEDNLYYFRQEGKTRTLYKNKMPLYSYKGYYGIVSDVDTKGRVLFIASSSKGSTLFRFSEEKVDRVLNADNVVEARLIDDNEVLAAAVGEEDYYYSITSLASSVQDPYEEVLFFEKASRFNSIDKEAKSLLLEKNVDLSKPYHALTDLHYGATLFSAAITQKNNKELFSYNVTAILSDPLITNTLLLFVQSGLDEVGTAGASYTNDASFVEFSATLYGVYSRGDASSYYLYNEQNNTYGSEVSLTQAGRDYGLSAYVKLPVLKRGYDKGSVLVNYYQDYDDSARSPLSLKLDFSHTEKFAESMYNNYQQLFSLFGSYERGDTGAGFEYGVSHDLPVKFFVGANLKSVGTTYNRDALSSGNDDYTRGVKFTPYNSSLQNDPTTMVMPTLEYTRFVKQASRAELFIKKQFDLRALYFTFPFSLVREGLYLKQCYYNIYDYGQGRTFSGHTVYNETTAGITLDVLMLNRLVVPLNIEYLYNNNTQEQHSVRFYFSSFAF